MRNLNVSQPLSCGSPASRFLAAKAMTFTLALAEHESVAWKARITSMASPELEGCSGPYGWRDDGIPHGGRLEVDAGGEATFIFTESGSFDSYEYFGPGSFINPRGDKGNGVICRMGGVTCKPLDEWTSNLPE